MEHKTQSRSILFGQSSNALRTQIAVTLIAAALFIATQGVLADDAAWEFKVVVLQGVTAGGTIEEDAGGIYVDRKRTRALNTLAADGWGVIAVTGAVATDHPVYLRRRTSR